MSWGLEPPENGHKCFSNLLSNKNSGSSVSRSISKDQDSRVGEYATAVLAAAFTIQSIEE